MKKELTKDNMILILTTLFAIELVILGVFFISRNTEESGQTKESNQENIGGNGNQILSYPKGTEYGQDLKAESESEFYQDWRMYEYVNEKYSPSYSDKLIPNIDYILDSKNNKKRIEINGLSPEKSKALFIAIINMVQNSSIGTIRLYMEGGGMSSFEDKWVAISLDIILDNNLVPTSNEGNALGQIHNLFAKNNNDGTWTAAYDGDPLKNELVKSLPDEYFKPPFYKENFLN